MEQYFVYFVGVVSAADRNVARSLAEQFLKKHDLHQIVVNKVIAVEFENISSCLELNKKESK